MAVYVDDMEAGFGNMIMCHMIADSTEELLAMVDAIGVQRKWIQHPGTYKEHFDIAKSKRAIAIRHGAIQITWRQYAEKVNARKGGNPPSRPTVNPHQASLLDSGTDGETGEVNGT